MGRFLDKTGVTFLWQSLKSYINKVMPQKVSELQNDSGYITGVSKITFTGSQSAVYDGKSNITVNVSGGGQGTTDYTDLTNKPSVNGVELSGNKTTSQLGITIPTKVSELENDRNYVLKTTYNAGLAAKADTSSLARVATSGSYNDLSGKPTIPTVPSNISSFTNDAGYITQATVDSKVDASALKTVAFSGSYNDLTNKPNIPDSIEIDSSLSSTSTHAVSNSAITAALNTKQNTLTSGTNIKTISIGGTEYSLLGSGTIPISTSSGGDPVVYTLDDIADGSTRKLSDYLKPSDLVYDDESGDYNYIAEDDTYTECMTALDRAIGNAMFLSGNQSVYGIKTFLNSNVNFQPGTGAISFTTNTNSKSILKNADAVDWSWIVSGNTTLQNKLQNLSAENVFYVENTQTGYLQDNSSINDCLESLALTIGNIPSNNTTVHKAGNETITGNKTFATGTTTSFLGANYGEGGNITINLPSSSNAYIERVIDDDQEGHFSWIQDNMNGHVVTLQDTLDSKAPVSTTVTLTGSQRLTNKTIYSPSITGATSFDDGTISRYISIEANTMTDPSDPEYDIDYMEILQHANDVGFRWIRNGSTNLQTVLDSKQNALVSGTNIKTINGNSILGSGNITISGGGSAGKVYTIGGNNNDVLYYNGTAISGFSALLEDEIFQSVILYNNYPYRLRVISNDISGNITLSQATKLFFSASYIGNNQLFVKEIRISLTSNNEYSISISSQSTNLPVFNFSSSTSTLDIILNTV